MNYTLNNSTGTQNTSTWQAIKKLWPLIVEEKKIVLVALFAVIVNSALNLFVPVLIAHAVDTYILQKNYHGVLVFAGLI